MSSLVDINALAAWVRSLHADHYSAAVPVEDFGFPHLARAWEPETLARTRVAMVGDRDPLPVPPASLLPGFDVNTFAGMAGITFGNLYFVREGNKREESLHFHELVHVVQWNLLGIERFLEVYIAELIRADYRGNHLEQMAYYLQDLFTAGKLEYKGEVYVRAMLQGWNPGEPI